MGDDFEVVTGSLGYSGRWITKRLLEKGVNVKTLTNAVGRENPFGNRIEIAPLDFRDIDNLAKSMQGAKVLYNTYWVRYKKEKHGYDHEIATRNSSILFEAAAMANVEKVVHFSVSKVNDAPDWPYFSGKAKTEQILISSGLNYSILRSTLFFGGQRNVLVNNIAWILRKSPVFGIFGTGDYSVQPIHIDDVAKISIDAAQDERNSILEVAGPETFSYREFVSLISRGIGVRRIFISIPPRMGWLEGRGIGAFLRDDVITMAEINGLMQGLMASDGPPMGSTKFSNWLLENGKHLGTRYKNDISERRYDARQPR